MTDAGGIIIAAALVASAGYFFVRQFTKESPRPHLPSYDLSPWGDVVYLHPEARRTTARMGQRGDTGAEQEQPSVTQQVIAHDRGHK